MLREQPATILRRLARMQRRPVVFVFHDVPDRQLFERCIGEIAASRQVLPLEAVARRREKNTCAITFDDGRRSVADVADPILAGAKLPYTVFVCTDVLLSGPAPWFVRVDQLADQIGLGPLRTEWGLGAEYTRTKEELTIALKEIPLDRIVAGLGGLERAHQLSARAPEPPFLSPADVVVLADKGVSVGAHTCRHPILSKLS